MFYKLIFLFFLLSFNPCIAGEASLDEVKTKTKTVTDHLNEYYSEFKQPTSIKDECKCDTNSTPKPKTLDNYYSEYL